MTNPYEISEVDLQISKDKMWLRVETADHRVYTSIMTPEIARTLALHLMRAAARVEFAEDLSKAMFRLPVADRGHIFSTIQKLEDER
jgi:hypothetical protein